MIETTAGYTGGRVPNPTYTQVCDGGTDHVEAVQVQYDPDQVSYEQQLDVFWKQVEKITLQLLDYHTKQYTPVIYYHDEEQARLALASREHSSRGHLAKRLTDIRSARTFYGEPDEYHQHYCQKQGECH